MDQACAVWARLFAPFECFDTFTVATAPALHVPKGAPAELTALGRALGFDSSSSQAAAGLLSSSTVSPPLEWVRGWPIKPLALLLTKRDLVLMLDADSIPALPLARLFAFSHDGFAFHGLATAGGSLAGLPKRADPASLIPALSQDSNLFWPDMTPHGPGFALLRSALG
eukprot:CAMPEP_0172627794 /NCGR_PEP_ID=MMETSP1068-20121228/158123_1 /TAXON_ID=35684 /ORGANISM="Pseudopedinella elastica, Strain CCMP716" /LENGTH=168 /DNA_ID=CAMNT_0013437789 /DNA_START=53 /DNA_END=555 /DNA_ORIENTATION=-